MADGNETGVAGNGTIATAAALAFNPIAFDAGTELRWGVLKLASAYGSPLNNLALTFETQYWDGLRFRTNSADQCTTLATGTLAMANWRQSLAACDTGLAAANVKVSAGRAFFTLAKPPAGRYGSTDVTPQLGAAASGQTCVGSTSTAAIAAGQPWLQGKWNNSASYDQNPTARAAFGPYRSPLIYLHESF